MDASEKLSTVAVCGCAVMIVALVSYQLFPGSLTQAYVTPLARPVRVIPSVGLGNPRGSMVAVPAAVPVDYITEQRQGTHNLSIVRTVAGSIGAVAVFLMAMPAMIANVFRRQQSAHTTLLAEQLALKATTGTATRIFAVQIHNAPLPLNLHEVDVAMAAAASKKAERKTKKVKAKKEEKPEKVPIVLTPREVKDKMRKAVLRLTKKPLKTTGRVCQLLGKVDNRQARSISFSHRRTRRVQHVNLHWRRLWWEEGKCFVLLRLSTKGIKTITRYGLHQAAIKFGLDLTRHINGISARKWTKYLPEKDRKLALLRDPELRYKNAVRWAKLNDLEVPLPPELPKKGKTKAKAKAPTPAQAEAEPAVIAMAISHGLRLPQLNKSHSERKALFRSLTTELIRHGRIKTTFHRAKAIRKHVDHMITLAKQGSLHDRRQALAYIYDKSLVKTLFEQVPERYANRQGGYTRIIRTMPRKGDCAKMCYIELL